MVSCFELVDLCLCCWGGGDEGGGREELGEESGRVEFHG